MAVHYITQIPFDFGTVKLVCTDQGIVAAGLLERLTEVLAGSPYAVYDGTPSNPTEAAVLQTVAAYRAHNADGRSRTSNLRWPTAPAARRAGR